MSNTPVSIVALVLAVALAYALGQGVDRNAFFLQPAHVDAGRPDTLEVVSYRYGCGTVFTHASLQRTGSRINVRFLPQERPEIVCPAVVRPYGPAFDLPALPAGRYDVYATVLMPCQVAPQPCDVPEKAERVGILEAGPVGEADWYLSPATAPSNQVFSLRLLSEKYGNCGTTFEHASLEREGNVLTAAFVVKTDTSVVCVLDVRPHGPAFQAGPLAAGKYPVRVVEVPACVYSPQPCPWQDPGLAARLVDTLVIGPATVQVRRGGPDREASGARTRTGLRRVGGTLAVTNGGADLQGRRLEKARMPRVPPAAATGPESAQP